MQKTILRGLTLGGAFASLALAMTPAEANLGGSYDPAAIVGPGNAAYTLDSGAVGGGKGDRSSRYTGLIAKHARAAGVPIKLAHAIVRVESNYNANARGGAGEIGLMQIKPATARGIGYSGSARGLYDPDTNLRYGMRYLGEAYKLAGGSVCGTVLRYNAGHYARRMNPVSQRYCNKVASILKRGGGLQTVDFASNAGTVGNNGGAVASRARHGYDPTAI